MYTKFLLLVQILRFDMAKSIVPSSLRDSETKLLEAISKWFTNACKNKSIKIILHLVNKTCGFASVISTLLVPLSSSVAASHYSRLMQIQHQKSSAFSSVHSQIIRM